MDGESDRGRRPVQFNDIELSWIGEHIAELRAAATGQRLLSQSLALGLTIGLVAHIAGYLLRSSVATEPWLLLADLLYALGWSLWTGVVVAYFIQIFPASKRRQIKQALDEYDRALREKAKTGTARGSVAQGGPDAPGG